MSKFGVGVGDDFPVDDGNGNRAAGDQAPGNGNANADDRADYEEWKRRRDAYRAQREQWRAQREEWKNRRRAFKEKVRAAARDSFGRDWSDYRDYDDHRRHRRGGHSYWPFWMLLPILGIVLFVSLISAIFKSPLVFVALAAIGFFWFSHRHHQWDKRHRDYDFDLKPANGPQPSATIVTPPPAPQDGGK